MTKESKRHGEAMAEFHEREGTDTLASAPHPDREDRPEPYFSWRPCDVCGSHLGGDREDYVGFKMGQEEPHVEVSVCVDCVYFNEYGCLPGEQ